MSLQEILKYLVRTFALMLMIVGFVCVAFLLLGYDVVPTSRVCP